MEATKQAKLKQIQERERLAELKVLLLLSLFGSVLFPNTLLIDPLQFPSAAPLLISSRCRRCGKRC